MQSSNFVILFEQINNAIFKAIHTIHKSILHAYLLYIYIYVHALINYRVIECKCRLPPNVIFKTMVNELLIYLPL